MQTPDLKAGQSGLTPIDIEGTNLVHREWMGDRWVYVKQYIEDDWDATREVISQRLDLEVRTMKRVCQRRDWPRRLGRVRVVEADAKRGLLATEEVPGISLEAWIRQYRNSQYRTGLGLFFLAGKWLQSFQQLEVAPDDCQPIGNKNPTDLSEYVRIRIAELLGCGYRSIREKQWKAVMDQLQALEAEVEVLDRRLVMCHNDYAPGNIISDGYNITPIDFQMTAPGTPLQDVSYFLHRIEMTRLFRPWLIRPWKRWHRAFVRGYGREGLEATPRYKALKLRLLILRLLTYTKHKPKSHKQALHNRWVLAAVRYKLLRELKS